MVDGNNAMPHPYQSAWQGRLISVFIVTVCYQPMSAISHYRAHSRTLVFNGS